MADTTKDLAEVARAKAWLDMAQSKWRLQTLQHRSRYNPKTGVYRQLPTRIRRFLNGTPVGMKTLVLSLLEESAPYKSPVFDCETDDLLYRPTNTFIRKDGVEHTTGGKDPTYTIIQDLLLVDEHGDTFRFGDESSCAQVGETEYHWDEPSVADCPDGAQGVSYQVTDVSRDRETDLFSYRVRKVQALTVHVAPHVDDCDARRRVTTESWDNVYGEPGAFRWDSVRGGGAALPVPAPCEQPDGRSVKVDVYRNPDCTYRVTVQTVDAVTDPEAQYSIYRDQYKINASERVLNAFSPLPRAGVEYSGGVMTRYTSEHNEDGTWNNATEVETERPVPSSTVEVRRTPRGVLSSWVDTNQPRAASGISTQFGSWKSTKTPGGLFTNEYSEYTKQLIDNLGLVCNDTAFMKTHETQASVGEVPAGAHVPPAGNGLVTTWNYDTDGEGFVTRRVRTEQEHTVEYAVRRRTWGYLGTTSGYLHRSVSAAYAEQLYSSGNTGTSVEVKLTNGGMYDVDVQTFLRVTGLRLGFECAKTVYQHMHEDVTSADAVGAEAQDAGGGHTYQRTFVVDTATGAITRRDRDTTELHVPESRRSVRVTARGTVVRSTESNAAARPQDAANPGQETEWEVTPGGRYNVTRTTTAPRAQENGATCEKDLFLHSDGTTDMRRSKPAGHVEGGSGGFYRERAARLGDDGLWEVTENAHEERLVERSEERFTVTSRMWAKTTVTRNTDEPGEDPEPVAGDVGRRLVRSKTRGGLWNVEETEIEAIEGDTAKACARDLFLHTDVTGRTEKEALDRDHLDPAADMSGLYASVRQRLGDDGLWDIETTENQENAVEEQRVDERVTRHGLVKRTTAVQVTREGNALRADPADMGKERVVEKTRGKRRNLTTVEITPFNDLKTADACEKTAFLHTDAETWSRRQKPQDTHVDDAGEGIYREDAWTLTDIGTWEQRKTTHNELQPDLKIHKYQDAFGETLVTEEFSHNGEDGGQGGKIFDEETLIQSVEAQLTNGRRYTVRTKEETPTEVDSGWLHFEKTTDKGLSIFYDFIVFRNATMEQVKEWIGHIQGIRYEAWEGSFANHPSLNISPNRFRLWDGAISLTTTFTPKSWAAGGNTKEDFWESDPIEVVSVNFIPLSQTKLLKVVTEETHVKGGGVGKDRMEEALAGGVIKGSQFAYHPSGQSYSYDLITKVVTKGVVMDMPGAAAAEMWNGTAL